MRVGLLADIHGNLLALDAVLADLGSAGADRLVCLGDVAALGPQPAEVVARLRELGCPSALGNVDAWLLDASTPDADATASTMADLTRWAAARLDGEDWAYLRACPPTLELRLDAGTSLLCFHGSPRSYDEVIAATTPEPELAVMLDGREAAILAGGHTHVQLLRRYGDAHLLNPGSVGLPGTGPGTPDLPVNRGVRWAEYAVLEVTGGRLSIDLRRVPLDVERLLAAGRASGMPHADWWAGKWGTPPAET